MIKVIGGPRPIDEIRRLHPVSEGNGKGIRPRKNKKQAAGRWRELNHLRDVIGPALSPAEAWVLFVLFSLADAKTKTVRISHEGIAKRTAIKRRRVIDIMSWLLARKHITLVQRGGQDKTTNVYRYEW